MKNQKRIVKKQNLKNYIYLIDSIGTLLESARKQVARTINNILVQTYWEIGKRIVEYEQKGGEKAEYGSELLLRLSKDLNLKYGKGFSKSNVYLMRLLYLKYQKFQTLSGKLSWSHYVELLSISDDLARSFYEKQCINENWSVRELRRQINSMLFERIALSKDKKGVFNLSKKGQQITIEEDIIKDPYVLEFLGIPEDYRYSEKELEQKIIDNLQMFLLELGKGFAFVKRQYRITLDNNHFYVDLVFYHTILKCYVLIDLKSSKITHQDIGQMNMYLNYFNKEVRSENDNPALGIVLGTEKDNILVEYALGGITNKLFISRYKLYLPEKKELSERLKYLLEKNKNND
ncbi:MAG TPA: PDDEXK nuclease domain-containing protein [bacterium]|nr:PDDEXK nuclease domain-containing protein [bacterium]HOL47290.1 PDDEXK nuclease domain-containing protein [bacterium]HPQ18682.1 PDDEXK nuclease domain-containing protein [bacterium]